MQLIDIYGRPVKRIVSKYRINWNTKSRSKLQYSAKQFLKKYWENHIVYEEFPVFGSRMKVDFLNTTKNIAIEINGNQHNAFNSFFHADHFEYRRSFGRDIKKIEWLESNNFKVIEINENEVPELSVKFIKEKFGISIV